LRYFSGIFFAAAFEDGVVEARADAAPLLGGFFHFLEAGGVFVAAVAVSFCAACWP